MTNILFSNAEDSHKHSLETLEALYEFDDFMQSIASMVDMGCGSGLDLEWWATRTTRDENPEPLNIQCTGIDIKDRLGLPRAYKNVRYQKQDFEESIIGRQRYDLVWAHDSFQFVIDVFGTLKNWHSVMNENAMLVITVPQTTNLVRNKQVFDQHDGSYYNWTMPSLIHALAVSGFDCKDGFFKKEVNDPWLHAIVYKGTTEPRDPRKTKFYDLIDQNVLPETAEKSVIKYGFLRQQDLVLPWVDRSLRWMGQE